MGTEMDWHDYLEPELDGPQLHCEFRCPKCGHREVLPEVGNTSLNVVCPKCKIKMLEDTES